MVGPLGRPGFDPSWTAHLRAQQACERPRARPSSSCMSVGHARTHTPLPCLLVKVKSSRRRLCNPGWATTVGRAHSGGVQSSLCQPSQPVLAEGQGSVTGPTGPPRVQIPVQ